MFNRIRSPRRGLLALLLALSTAGCAPSLVPVIRAGDSNKVKALLAKGANPDRESDGQTPLCEAITRNDADLVRALVAARASLGAPCQPQERRQFYWPLEWAGALGRPELVTILLDAGADPSLGAIGQSFLPRLPATQKLQDAEDTRGVTSAFLDFITRKYGEEKALEVIHAPDEKSGWTPLAAAAFNGNVAMVRQLLKYGADPHKGAAASLLLDGSDDEWPPYFFAIAGRFLKDDRSAVAKELLAVGANPDGVSENGSSVKDMLGALKRQSDEKKAARERAARWQRAAEIERRRSNEQAWSSFRAGLTGGATSPPVTNPVHDNSFQERMAALHASEGERKKREAERAREEQARQREEEQRARLAANEARRGGGSTANSSTTPTLAAPADDAARRQREEASRRQREEEERRRDEARRKEENERRARAEREEHERREKAMMAEAARRDAARERQEALATFRNGIRLKATKCPDGEGHYYVIGTRPSTKANDACINVRYRATCAANRGPSAGVLRNFVGGGSCFGDSQQISPKPACDVKDVTVMVDDVTFCE